MLRKFIFALAIILIGAGTAVAEHRSGIDLSSIDPGARPQEDFWQFANGKWLAATPIPQDRSAWNTFSEVREKTQAQLRSAIEAIDPKDPHPEYRKIADL